MRGGLGPLQAMGVTGALSFTLDPVEGGVEVALTYAVGGYHPQGLDVLAPIVDRVLGDQLARFKEHCEQLPPPTCPGIFILLHFNDL